MINVIRAEFRKLRRPTLTLGTLLATLFFSVLFTYLIFSEVKSPQGGGRPGAVAPTVESISLANGVVVSFQQVPVLPGIIALCIFAAQMAQEYTYGTLRNLLVRQPSRMKILAGKYISMSIFGLLIVAASAITSIGVSYGLADWAGVNTTAWSSAEGTQAITETLVNVSIAVIIYGTIGMILGILLRSPISSIALGVIWFLILDNILSGVLSASAKWLPGQLIDSLTRGGTDSISYDRSATLLAIYVGISALVAAILFKRRDVAN